MKSNENKEGTAKLEIACFNEESAMIAANEGADRIELCESYSLGGITPAIETLQRLKVKYDIPIYVMIRPRGGDFIYNDEEFLHMKDELATFYEAGADGFVFGILTPDLKIDVLRNTELVDLAKGKPCTFHRAFDLVQDDVIAMEEVISCGFTTILSSGGDHPAIKGISILMEMKNRAAGRITILVGGGVRSGNLMQFKRHFDFVHTASIKPGTEEIDVKELRAIKAILDGPDYTL